MTYFSPAQIVGYASFFLGVAAFLQKSDRRLKLLNASQALVYSLHFVLLGNLPASAAALISSVRSYLAVRTRSLVLAAAIVVLNLAAGARFAHGAAGWLTPLASSAATIAMFTTDGIPLRVVLLGCTMLWLTNNILSGSIGGTVLEAVIGAVNLSTIVRLARQPAQLRVDLR